MLGLTAGELTLVLILVGAVVSARFWPAVGAALAVRLAPPAPAPPTETGTLPKSERTSTNDSA